MPEVFLISVGTLALAWISRASLFRPASHGFSRFFAWEGILALFVLEVPVWFSGPFSLHQLLSWSLLLASLPPLVLGVSRLRSGGRGGGRIRADPALYDFEKTTALVTDGIYRYIRHPLYASLLLLAWGIFMKGPGILAGILVGATSLSLYITARRDEVECLACFGEAYRAYMGRSKRFIPFLL